ncbi:MAG TPA: glycosyltransferase, partial [Methylophilus sp.]
MPYRILWTLPYLPWPISSGGKLRQFQLIKTLAARGHEITVLAQSKYPLTPEIEAALKPHVKELIVLPRRSLTHPLSLLLAAVGHLPMLASVNGYSKTLTRTFEQLLQTRDFDVVQVEHSYGLQPFLAVLKRLNRKFLLTEHNVESRLIPATYQHLPALLKPYKFLDAWRYRRWEKQVLQQATRVAAVTREDADVMATIAQRPVDVVINGVDVAYYAGVQPDYRAKKILFVGNMEYPPNLDAVHLTVEQIMPLVWQTCPDAELVVCGYGMPAEWATRWPDPRLKWKG